MMDNAISKKTGSLLASSALFPLGVHIDMYSTEAASLPGKTFVDRRKDERHMQSKFFAYGPLQSKKPYRQSFSSHNGLTIQRTPTE